MGGTGLYLQAALTDLELRPPPPPGLRERIAAEAEARGVEALHADLAARAPAAAAAIEPTDRTRVIRSLELLEMGEEPAPAGSDSRLWAANLRHPTLLAGLTMPLEELYARIDTRVDAMLAAGAAEEVRRAHCSRCIGDRSQGARLRGAASRGRRGHEAPHPQLCAPPAHLAAEGRGR